MALKLARTKGLRAMQQLTSLPHVPLPPPQCRLANRESAMAYRPRNWEGTVTARRPLGRPASAIVRRAVCESVAMGCLAAL